MKSVNNFFDAGVVHEATKVVDECLRTVLAHVGESYYFLLRAVAGAGKTEAVIRMAREARKRKIRLAIVNPSNEQVFQTLRRLLTGLPGEIITYAPASNVEVPSDISSHPRVQIVAAKDAGACGLLVGTIRKLGDAFCRGDLLPAQLLIVDEAYQADAASYFTVADLAPTHFLVGDAGQLDPFSTAPDPNLFRGLLHDPLQTAVGVLRRHGTLSGERATLCTYRLPARSAELARSFYPGISFCHAIRDDVRELSLRPVKARGVNAVYDRVLDTAAVHSLAHLELRGQGAPDDDPEMVEVMASLVQRFFQRRPVARCERGQQLTELKPAQVAIVVAHRRQKIALRATLDALNLDGVFVETDNRNQGLEFSTVFNRHSLAGLSTADAFHLEPGRTCVGLTRHRHACIVIGREGDRNLLDGFPPITPVFPEWDSDPLLDGWDTHRQVFEGLEPYRSVLV
jgi:hypothetical protein